MKLIKLDKKQLNNFIKSQRHSQFLQSWEWGEFQEKMGLNVFRLGLQNKENKIIFAISIIKKKLPLRQSYFYAPRIEVKCLSLENLNFLFLELKKIAQKEKAIFFRFEPRSESLELKNFIIKPSKDIQPKRTIILDLQKTEEELLKDMHQKTRYNIRLAKRKEVEIVEATDFEEFWKLMNTTKTRNSFRLHSKGYYQKMLEIGFIKLFFAKHHDKVIATNIVSFFGDLVVYIHGGSANEYRNLMPAYALQWHCIKLAKELDYKYYDFYGVDEKKWPGVTRFKKGFFTKETSYPGTFDLIFKKEKYFIYKLLRKILSSINKLIKK